LIQAILEYFDPSNVTPSNILQVTEIIKNVEILKARNQLPIPESQSVLELIN